MQGKVLIANRGEIAVRVIRSCRVLGLSPVAVYSDADSESMHVRLSDESYHIGPSNPARSYLNIEALSQAITRSGADAVHPGYGFLSENWRFARAVEDLGVRWVGPSSRVMEKLISKTESRNIARRAGVPVLPGSGMLESYTHAKNMAWEIGAPVLLKADKGGGGKGVRKISAVDDFTEELFSTASRESQYAFGSADMYLEKMAQKPRHIEVQIMADRDGSVTALGERECSVQRRYQKIVEESPSIAIDGARREEVFDYAKRFTSEAGYLNCGTVEFLLDEEGGFRFLEMNKRIQVEHPVTEMVTGLDLVGMQLMIAFGRNSGIDHDVCPRGHAIECRVYAEDPVSFMPSPGRIRSLSLPEDEGIRIDHSLEPNSTVSSYYDPLIAKIITHGPDRRTSIALMKKALTQTRIEGIKVNTPFLMDIVSSDWFEKGEMHTALIDQMNRR